MRLVGLLMQSRLLGHRMTLCAVFQQIDVEEAPYTGASQSLRMFGVTDVCALFPIFTGD